MYVCMYVVVYMQVVLLSTVAYMHLMHAMYCIRGNFCGIKFCKLRKQNPALQKYNRLHWLHPGIFLQASY